MSLLSAVKHELRQVGLVTLYFLFCFGIVLTLKKLFLAEQQIEFYALSVAIVGALIVGKVVVILDKTPVGTRLGAGGRPALAALYKTLAYTAATFLVLMGEQVLHAYRAIGALGPAVTEAWEHRDRNVFFAKVLCVGLAFLGYHLFVATDQRLGKGTLWRAIWDRK